VCVDCDEGQDGLLLCPICASAPALPSQADLVYQTLLEDAHEHVNRQQAIAILKRRMLRDDLYLRFRHERGLYNINDDQVREDMEAMAMACYLLEFPDS
jgi:hypothetical protein